MWHMPTHIYYPLRRYPEAAWQLEACLRTENARIEPITFCPTRSSSTPTTTNGSSAR